MPPVQSLGALQQAQVVDGDRRPLSFLGAALLTQLLHDDRVEAVLHRLRQLRLPDRVHLPGLIPCPSRAFSSHCVAKFEGEPWLGQLSEREKGGKKRETQREKERERERERGREREILEVNYKVKLVYNMKQNCDFLL